MPTDENLNVGTVMGPGLVLNSTFGSPAHQPTNTQPIVDTQRVTPLGTWFNTTVIVELDHVIGNLSTLHFRFRVNNNTQQPTVYFIDDIVINSLGFDDTITTPEWDLTLPSLAEIYEDYFFFGNILEPALINNNPRGVLEMFLHHYNSVTAENAMKVDSISGGGNVRYRPSTEDGNIHPHLLDGARTMVNFAESNSLNMVGHALVWHGQSSRWLYRHPETDAFLTRSEAMENMRWFISQYAGYFDGRIDAWDVTNEVFTNSGGANNPNLGTNDHALESHMLDTETRVVYPVGSWQRALRNYAPWYQSFANGADFEAGERGFDYIYYSFVFARTYAPSATLIYNDFNDEMPAKRNAMASMVEEFNERRANDAVNNPAYNNPNHPDYGRLLIEAIGMQAHYNQSTNLEHVRDSLDRFIETGARIHITELDIQFHNPAASFELSEAQLQQQADMFAQLFRWYVERAEHIDRVTIWGREDGTSWRGQNGATHFDRNYNPKPAFWAIVDPFGHIGEDWPSAPEQPPTVPESTPPPVNPEQIPTPEPPSESDQVPPTSLQISVVAMQSFLASNTPTNRIVIPVNATTDAQITAAITAVLNNVIGVSDDIAVSLERQNNTAFATGQVNNITVRLSVNPTYDIINQIIYFSATLPQTGINVTQPIFAGVILIIPGIVLSKFTKRKR